MNGYRAPSRGAGRSSETSKDLPQADTPLIRPGRAELASPESSRAGERGNSHSEATGWMAASPPGDKSSRQRLDPTYYPSHSLKAKTRKSGKAKTLNNTPLLGPLVRVICFVCGQEEHIRRDCETIKCNYGGSLTFPRLN
ncbi:unnamed protein product [Eretmochelys imbricata]